ncbi:hypothetical protein AB0E01_33160 [Nocardia vinacea]|uniref:hypothetical protein n=1 Tax=Nocardia vinacea TaxID=96468 RepID=UPI00340E31C4
MADDSADTWRRLTDQANQAIEAFRKGITDGIDQYWKRKAANSAMEAGHPGLSTVDEILGHIPGNGVLKLGKHRANEAAAHAQNVGTEIYQPGVTAVDQRTPIVPEPVEPVSKDEPAVPGIEEWPSQRVHEFRPRRRQLQSRIDVISRSRRW